LSVALQQHPQAVPGSVEPAGATVDFNAISVARTDATIAADYHA
jgi:hypothetical protein